MATDGKHVKIQIYGAQFERLASCEVAARFLDESVHAAEMRQLGAPHVYDIKETLLAQGQTPDVDEPEGVTGVAVLSTSHVAVHTWPHRGYAVVDVFSCRGFEIGELMRVARESYGARRVTVADLSYSLELPAAWGEEHAAQ